MSRSVVLAVALAACTATHPLDSYSSEYGKQPPPEDAGPPPPDAADTVEPPDAAPDDAGCAGNPTILEPAPNATVGATMRVRVSAPTCIATMIVYIDYKEALRVEGSALDQTFPISVGSHKLNVNGWAHTSTAHTSPLITVTRTQ